MVNIKKQMRLHENVMGKFLAIIQLAFSSSLFILFWNSRILPAKYIVLFSVISIILFLGTFVMQHFNTKKMRYLGTGISILVSIVMVAGIIGMSKATNLMADVGGSTYKTDNMVVVVKVANSAESLMDAKDYRFGYQTTLDQDNNQVMIEDVNAQVGKAIKTAEYQNIAEEAQALLDGRIEAAIYNEAFTGIIEEYIEGYSEQVRVLYKYGIQTEVVQEEDKDVREPFNVYISGIDVEGDITTNSRSDLNIIMTVNPNTKEILLTTTPRDYFVKIPGVSGETRDKLTHAGIYGVDKSMETLEALYDIDIDYYARVNFTSVVKIVDALGGIDVHSDYEFTTLHGNYHIEKGMNHMDGDKALCFCRERYSFKDGDNQRGKNQQAVLTEILKKAMSPAILTSAVQIMNSVSDSVDTNMTQEEMAELLKMQLDDGASWTFTSQAAVGSGSTQNCYSSGSSLVYVMIPDTVSVEQMSKNIKTVIQNEK